MAHCKQPVSEINPRTGKPYRTCAAHGHRGMHVRPKSGKRKEPGLYKLVIGHENYTSRNSVVLLISLDKRTAERTDPDERRDYIKEMEDAVADGIDEFREEFERLRDEKALASAHYELYKQVTGAEYKCEDHDSGNDDDTDDCGGGGGGDTTIPILTRSATVDSSGAQWLPDDGRAAHAPFVRRLNTTLTAGVESAAVASVLERSRIEALASNLWLMFSFWQPPAEPFSRTLCDLIALYTL